MIGRVVEVAGEGRVLARSRGFLTVSRNGIEEGRVPLDDIGVLLCNARDLTYTNDLVAELAAAARPSSPAAPTTSPRPGSGPSRGHHVQALRMRRQLEASLPLRKRLWQAIVKAKIERQAGALELLGIDAAGVRALARRVRSGDPENVEAQAARRYWPLLFGKDFKRERFGPMPNPFLNYGYTVLRAAVARAVVAAGLHPSLGVHHHNRGDALCLVDDLMEPFRPVVDATVVRLRSGGHNDLTTEAKGALAGFLTLDMATERGTTPLQTCLERAAQSLAQSFESGKPALIFPVGPLAAP